MEKNGKAIDAEAARLIADRAKRIRYYEDHRHLGMAVCADCKGPVRQSAVLKICKGCQALRDMNL